MKITVEHLSIAVPGHDGKILDDVTFEARSGEVLGIVGPSGCGKSSLFEAIVGLIASAKGAIRFNGTAAGEERIPIGYLPQRSSDLIFPSRSVERNLRLVRTLRSHDAESGPLGTQALLERMKLLARKTAYPGVLSGGERRRLALAMILSFCPAALLLDEPFTGVDLDLRLDLWELVYDYLRLRRAKPTVLIITHSLEEAAVLSDRVLFFCRGRNGTNIHAIGEPRAQHLHTEGLSPELLYRRLRTALAPYLAHLESQMLAALERP